MHDGLILAKVQAAVCDLPHPDRSSLPIILVATVYTVVCVLIALRLVSKIWVSRTMGTDDWMIISALVILFISVFFTIKMAKMGFGKHVWDLQDGDLMHILEYFYIAENAYVVAITLAKISILFLYLRLFEHHPSFRLAAHITIFSTAVATLVLSFITIFSCYPVAYFWDRDIKGGRCLNIQNVAYAVGALSIVEDLVIVALPFPVLFRLQMSTSKKVGIGVMFVLGGLGCIVSMIRLKSLMHFSNSVDPSWDNVPVVTWTVIELCAAMICASLPALRLLVMHLFPRIFPSSLRSASKTPVFSTREGSGLKSWQTGTGLEGRKKRLDSFLELERSGTDTPPEVPPKD